MASGGARNRSGPQPDPNSARSDRRGLSFASLPTAGYDGKAPAFPLPSPSARERAVWRELWRTPQASAWASESWRWRSVAMYARWSVRMEELDAPSAVAAAVRRLADEIGLTPAGLKENGWKIDAAPPAVKRSPAAATSEVVVSAKNRLTVVKSVG